MARRLRLAATFAAETLAPAVRFWIDALALPFELEIVPGGPLAAAVSAASGGPAGDVSALVVRLEDWEPAEAERLRAHLDELVAAAGAPGPPRLVVFAPASLAADPARRALFEELEGAAAARLAASGVAAVASRRVRELYPVERPDDPQGLRLAHAPYTPEAAAALGTVVIRQARALVAPAAKVVAVDCDETLWSGVAAEAGTQGLVIDAPRLALGRDLVAEAQRGRLVCLCSQNREEDVWAVFDERDDLPLRREHVAAAHVAWGPKSEGLRRLAARLKLGLDSFVFLDDSPVEIAEVEARAPQVLAVRLPEDAAAIARVLRHVWPLDGGPATGEAAARTAAYASEADRERLREEAPSFARYLEKLELRVDVADAAPADRPRVAELTFRTSQWNASGRRLSAGELAAALEEGGTGCRVARVRDRFGDYGLVGVALFRAEGDTLLADTLLLSCRALGRGVEHRMLADLGAIALARGLARVAVPFVPTARNRPAQAFLESVLREAAAPREDGSRVFALDAATAAAVRFDPEAVAAGPAASPTGPGADAAGPPAGEATARPHPLLARIPHELADARAILAAVEADRARRAAQAPRGPASRAPATAVERVLAELWREVLGVSVGAEDGFFEAGGDSIHAVRLAVLLKERLGVDVPLATLFEASSVAALARRLVADAQLAEEEMRQLLDEVDGLSDAEVEAALAAPAGAEAPAAVRVLPREAPSAGEVWSACAEAKGDDDTPAPIDTLAVVTRDRPEWLARAVASWSAHLCRASREATLLVCDDSAEDDGEARCREALGEAARGWPGPIAYVGRPARGRLARELAATGIPEEVAAFGLLDPLGAGHTSGAARNALTLATLGRLVFSVDDDTVCRPTAPPRRAAGVALSAGRPPGDLWTFATRDEALAAARETEDDVLAAHERLLGRRARDVVHREAAGAEGLAIGERTRGLADRVKGGARVAVTVSGLVGDCGWGAPFGIWRHPLGSLLVEGASLERLVASPEAYEAATARREILRVVDRPTLADDAGSMTTFVGLDNRLGLPPFLPMRRGQDLVLGGTLWLASDAVYGHVPLALLHAPDGRRPFAPGEHLRTAGALDLAKLVLALMDAAAEEEARDGGLVALGRRLAAFAAEGREAFEERLRARRRLDAARHAALVEEAIAAAPAPARAWVEDLRRFAARKSEAAAGPDAVVPLDLVEGRGVDAARELAREIVRRFGALLEWWPRITRAAAAGGAPGLGPATRW